MTARFPDSAVEFSLRSIEDRMPMGTDITVACVIEGIGDAELEFRLLYEDEKGDWFKTEWDQGTWRVENWLCVTRISAPSEYEEDQEQKR